MIKITAKSTVKAGARDQFIATARELVEKSRAEAGNISYHLYEDVYKRQLQDGLVLKEGMTDTVVWSIYRALSLS